MNLFSLNDQVILVTGSSRGLGWEMAKAMAEAGATAVSYTHLTLPTMS